MKAQNIYIGYDPREAIAYHTMVNSFIRHSSIPLNFTPLALDNFKDFFEETHQDGSNQFIYSRFLTPYLNDYKGWALFCDGDMIVLDDVKELFDMRDDSKAVMVVKHDYKTRMTKKYLGAVNQDYPRKNWSSVILWNCGHKKNKKVTPEFIMNSTGAELHRFTWLDDKDIGEIPVEWNWLDGEFDRNPNKDAKLIHYTLGTPCFGEFGAFGSYASEWHRERMYTDYCKQTDDMWTPKGLE